MNGDIEMIRYAILDLHNKVTYVIVMDELDSLPAISNLGKNFKNPTELYYRQHLKRSVTWLL